MNWLLTLLFFVVMFTYFYLIGDYVISFFSYPNRFSHKIVYGFLSYFLLSTVITVPCKLFKLSWNIFVMGMSILHIIIFVLCVLRIYRTGRIKTSCSWNKELIKDHIKRNWYVYFLAICFIFLYMMNTITFYTIGYDDRYYISKMVHSIGTSAIDNENFFTGALLTKGGVDVSRLFNSFELVYAYLASIFHIYVPFFAKITMSATNYIITFFVYKMYIDRIFKSKKSQYALVGLAILMIPIGLLTFSDNPFRIDMYDLWQITTSMFYGGALVRMISLPLYLIAFEQLYESFSLKKIIFIGLLSASLISFSTIMTVPFCMIGLSYLFLVFNDYFSNKFKNQINSGLSLIIVFFICFAILLVINTGLRFVSLRHVYLYRRIVSDYEQWYKLSISTSITFIILPIEFILLNVLSKNKLHNPILLMLMFIFFIIYFCMFNGIVLLTSFNLGFVVKRFISSIQIISLVLAGIIFVMILERYSINRMIPLIIICISVSSIGVPYLIRSKTTALSLASVKTTYNYEFGISLNNDYMVPDVIHDVGEYFNSKSDGHYLLMFPVEFDWDFHTIKGDYFLMSSKNIVLAFPDDNVYGLTSKKYGPINRLHFIQLNKFLNNSVTYDEILPLLKKYKIQYLFVTNEYVADTLESHHHKVVLQSNEKYKSYKLFELKI